MRPFAGFTFSRAPKEVYGKMEGPKTPVKAIVGSIPWELFIKSALLLSALNSEFTSYNPTRMELFKERNFCCPQNS
jgi:hypothetical protein